MSLTIGTYDCIFIKFPTVACHRKLKFKLIEWKDFKWGFLLLPWTHKEKKEKKRNSLDTDSLGVWYLGATFWIFYILCTWNVKFCSYLNCDVGFLSKRKKPDDQNLQEPVIDVVLSLGMYEAACWIIC